LKLFGCRCCVCLGEFEIKEELRQIPSCKHVFHNDCIRHWLHSNSTCPLCRCYVIFPATIFCTNPLQSSGPVLLLQSSVGANSHQPQNITSELQQQQDVGAGSTEQLVIPMEESSSVTSQLRDSSRLPELSISMENGRGSPNGESVILHIQRHST
jgi:E3 ubiquitin-protein ligase ATL7/58/59